MDNSGGVWKKNAKPNPKRNDRKSRSRLSGSPKKGGHGGKFTWSGCGYSHAELGRFDNAAAAAVDSNDPNFEDPEVATN